MASGTEPAAYPPPGNAQGSSNVAPSATGNDSGAGAAAGGLGDLLRFHGKYAPYAAKEPLHTVKIERRDDSLGMVLAGGTPFCPCVYVETIQNATLLALFEPGDEIVAINGEFLLGFSLDEVNEKWRAGPSEVEVTLRRLPEHLPVATAAGTLLRRTKQQFAEYFKEKEGFLDVLGIRRGIIVMDQDQLDEKREMLQRHIAVYTGLAPLLQRYTNAYANVVHAQEDMSMILTDVSLRERTTALCDPVLAMAESHRSIAKAGRQCVTRLQQVSAQIATVIAKVHPDVGLSLDKYEQQRISLMMNAVRLDDLQTRDAQARAQGGCTPESFIGNYELRDALRTCMRTKRAFERVHRDISEKLDICRAQNIRDICTHMAAIATAIHDCLDLCTAATAVAEQIILRCPDTALHSLRVLEGGPDTMPSPLASSHSSSMRIHASPEAGPSSSEAAAVGRRSTTPSDRSSLSSFDALSVSFGPTSSLALGVASVAKQSPATPSYTTFTPTPAASNPGSAVKSSGSLRAAAAAPPSLQQSPSQRQQQSPSALRVHPSTATSSLSPARDKQQHSLSQSSGVSQSPRS
eukprot:m.60936 g.60936  ORF g.60936 m.60936 type:complete len:577 (+) comp12317_c0_seq4:227-1957(+)